MPKSRTPLKDKSSINGSIYKVKKSTTRPKITDAASKRLYNKVYYLDNRDKIREHKRRYYRKNRDKILAKIKQEPSKTRRKVFQKQWSNQNLAKLAEYQRNRRLKIKLQQEVNELLRSHYQHQDKRQRFAIPNTRSVTV